MNIEMAIGIFLIFAVCGLVFALIRQSVHNTRDLARRRREDFGWYKREHPNHFRAGRVHCFNCDGTRLSVRHLMNRTYLRAHVCTQCGTTLYHSRET